mmetsp:Transcript_10529/g.15710  ORF Transcript_10529/g.15710 Transcript_10529/m.15710 type:complete len:98 (-) Transcript_10529:373-666(-)
MRATHISKEWLVVRISVGYSSGVAIHTLELAMFPLPLANPAAITRAASGTFSESNTIASASATKKQDIVLVLPNLSMTRISTNDAMTSGHAAAKISG